MERAGGEVPDLEVWRRFVGGDRHEPLDARRYAHGHDPRQIEGETHCLSTREREGAAIRLHIEHTHARCLSIDAERAVMTPHHFFLYDETQQRQRTNTVAGGEEIDRRGFVLSVLQGVKCYSLRHDITVYAQHRFGTSDELQWREISTVEDYKDENYAHNASHSSRKGECRTRIVMEGDNEKSSRCFSTHCHSFYSWNGRFIPPSGNHRLFCVPRSRLSSLCRFTPRFR